MIGRLLILAHRDLSFFPTILLKNGLNKRIRFVKFGYCIPKTLVDPVGKINISLQLIFHLDSLSLQSIIIQLKSIKLIFHTFLQLNVRTWIIIFQLSWQLIDMLFYFMQREQVKVLDVFQIEVMTLVICYVLDQCTLYHFVCYLLIIYEYLISVVH